jgi:hypothetical protein
MDGSGLTEAGSNVRRRRVFYIPGYDPFPPRRYRELYRREGAEQAAISGYEIAVGRGPGQPREAWRVKARIDGHEVLSDVEVLVWSDLVQGSMDQSIVGTYVQLFRTAGLYLFSGTLFRLMSLRKGPILAALYPVMMLLAQLGVAWIAGWAVASLLGLVLPRGLGWVAGVPVMVWLLIRFKRLDHRLFAYYLMHDYAYTARFGGVNPPELEARMADFRRAIRSAMDTPCDEVLVVGHSSGAHLAVSILADLLREGVPPGGPALSFLSLGQVVPMVSFLPRADRLRADLHDLAARDDLTWVDVTAPGDGCAFALCDPVAVTGVAPKGKRWPLVISAAFSQTLSEARWKALRWKFFRLHFQYLCAFDRPRDYDYFRITAGPMTLGARYAGRKPSRSRIDVPVSGYVSRSA